MFSLTVRIITTSSLRFSGLRWVSLDGLSALQVPKGTGPVMSVTFISCCLVKGLRQRMHYPCRNSYPGVRQGEWLCHVRTWRPKFWFCFSWQMGCKRRRGHVFSEGWPWWPGELMSSRLAAKFSQNMHCQESWRLSASAELGDLYVGVNVALVSTLQMAWCETNFTSCIDPLSAQPPHLFWSLNTSPATYILLHLLMASDNFSPSFENHHRQGIPNTGILISWTKYLLLFSEEPWYGQAEEQRWGGGGRELHSWAGGEGETAKPPRSWGLLITKATKWKGPVCPQWPEGGAERSEGLQHGGVCGQHRWLRARAQAK